MNLNIRLNGPLVSRHSKLASSPAQPPLASPIRPADTPSHTSTVYPDFPSPLLPFVLALILPIFAIAPLFYPGYIQSHSGLVTLWNVADLRANPGFFGWLPEVGLSFDPLRSDGLLPYYLAALLPTSPAVAVKLVSGLAWLLSSLGTYLWLRAWLGQAGAVVAAMVYTYLPYQIVNVYVRGAWGEALFFGLLPWAMWLTTRPGGSNVRSMSFARLFVAWATWLLLGLSHLGLTLWALALALAFLWLVQRRRITGPTLATAGGVTAAAVIIFSLAGERAAPAVLLTDHLLYPFQLFSAHWGFGASRPGWNDGLSLQIGLAALGLTIMGAALWPHRRQPAGAIGYPDRRLIFFLSAAVVLLLLQLYPAGLIWRLPVPQGPNLAGSLAYPWQLLGLAGLCLAVLAGSTLWLEPRLAQAPLFAAIVIFTALSSYGYLSPQFIPPESIVARAPEALIGNEQLALLDHNLNVATSANTAGLEQGQMTLPLAVHGPLGGNERLILDLTWHPLQPFDQDYKVFVHLVDRDNKVLAQFDGPPQEGQYPTSHWIPGELISDAYPLVLPAALPPGPYRIFLGLYDEATFNRLPVPGDSEGRIILNVQ